MDAGKSVAGGMQSAASTVKDLGSRAASAVGDAGETVARGVAGAEVSVRQAARCPIVTSSK
jgi:hypothetical protein